MDVTVFGPSIMAFGELCKEANTVINEGRSSVRVVIYADIEGNCLTAKLEVIQSLWQGVKDLTENKNAASAKNLLEWLGIIGVPGAAIRLIKFLVWKKDRQVEVKRTIVKDGSNYLEVNCVGDGNTINISPEVFKLSQSPEVVSSAKKLVAPVTEENGITTATFYQDKEKPVTIDRADAAALQASTVQETVEKKTFTAIVTVFAPVFDAKWKTWRFLMNGQHFYMDISETTIAADTMKRGTVRTGDSYRVEVERIDRTGKEPQHKIKKVLEFMPGQNAEQGDFLR